MSQFHITSLVRHHLSQHPYLCRVPPPKLRDAVIDAGGPVRQHHAEGAVPVATVGGVAAPAHRDVLLIVAHTLEAAHVVEAAGGRLVWVPQVSQLKWRVSKIVLPSRCNVNLHPFYRHKAVCVPRKCMGEYFIIFIRCKGEYYLQFSTSL